MCDSSPVADEPSRADVLDEPPKTRPTFWVVHPSMPHRGRCAIVFATENCTTWRGGIDPFAGTCIFWVAHPNSRQCRLATIRKKETMGNTFASIAAFATRAGRVDHVVSTASARARAKLADLEREDLRLSFDTKVIGPTILTKYFAPQMNPGGSFVLFSASTRSQLPHRHDVESRRWRTADLTA